MKKSKKPTKCKAGMLMKRGKCIKAPEYLEGIESRPFKQKMFSEDSYAKEYTKARKYAKKHGGVVYTMVDGEGSLVDYAKGIHSFDRLAVVVLQ